MYQVTYWKGDVYHIQQVELGIFSSKNWYAFPFVSACFMRTKY